MADNENKTPETNGNGRRGFLRLGLLSAGMTVAAGAGLTKAFSSEGEEESGEKVKMLTPDGRLIEVDSLKVDSKKAAKTASTTYNIREGVPGRKFIMVIDLARCGNARKCISGCQKMHNVLPPTEWIKVKQMQDTELTAPYWFPQPCYQCDNPPCTKVCPVEATFKRSDGIVAIDNDRCIGCKFCMAACPYSARTFNFGNPKQTAHAKEHGNGAHSCHDGDYNKVGTVSKCDFCPEAGAQGKLPECVTACPNGVIFYGDENEDVVSNGETSYRLKELLKDRAGYRQFEELGTKPRVYYLPPVNRLFEFKPNETEYNKDV